jgi:hypothetical protein
VPCSNQKKRAYRRVQSPSGVAPAGARRAAASAQRRRAGRGRACAARGAGQGRTARGPMAPPRRVWRGGREPQRRALDKPYGGRMRRARQPAQEHWGGAARQKTPGHCGAAPAARPGRRVCTRTKHTPLTNRVGAGRGHSRSPALLPGCRGRAGAIASPARPSRPKFVPPRRALTDPPRAQKRPQPIPRSCMLHGTPGRLRAAAYESQALAP